MIAASAAPSSTRTPINWAKFFVNAVPMVKADQATHEAVINSLGVKILSNTFHNGSKTTYVEYTTETAAPYSLPTKLRSLLKPVKFALPMFDRSKDRSAVVLAERGNGYVT